MRPCPIAAALLATALPLAATAQTTPAPDAFEAALATTPPAAQRAPVAGPWVVTSTMQRPPAPAGTIPARWRSLRAMPDDVAALQEDVTEGRLDPAALMAQIAGPLPLPPGSSPAGCYRQAGSLTFTTGERLSPAFDAVMVRSAKGQADIRDVLDRAAIDARPIRERLRRFFLAAGFREYERLGRREGFVDAARGLRVEVTDSSAEVEGLCRSARDPVRLPTGPTFRIEHGAKLGVNERWATGG